MIADVERFTGGHAVGVDVAAIERDLAALWRTASASGAEHSVTRACAWNLVVYATCDEELERAHRLADALVAVIPSRTLLLNQRDDTTGPEVEAFVTANCRLMPGGGKLLCTEEITIEARGHGRDHLPSLTRALLVPDIPSALLWLGMPPGAPRLPDLMAADRFIFDTGALGAEGLARVAALGPDVTARVADLAWLRSAPCRLAVAGAFDAPVDAGMLHRLARLTLTCAPEAWAGAKLLLGWLGARLDWGHPQPLRDACGWRVAGPQGALHIAITPTSGAAGIDSIMFESHQGETVNITATQTGHCIDGSWPTRQLAQPVFPDEALVVAALGPRGRDPLYAAALRRAIRFYDQ